MTRRKKIWATAVAGAAVLSVAGVVYAYTANSNVMSYAVIVQKNGSYTMVGGDTVKVLYSPWKALNGNTVKIAQEHFNGIAPSGAPDGKGTWPVLQADMIGADANNGYLLVAAPPELGGNSLDVKALVNRFGGNYAFVISYLKQNNQVIKTYDINNGTYYYYVPLASVVTESGGKFGTSTWTRVS